MDLFGSVGTDDVGIPVDPHAPLVVWIRPRTFDELQGQAHLLTPGPPPCRLVEPAEAGRDSHAGKRDTAVRPSSSSLSLVILRGLPGTGKTMLACLVVRGNGRRFVELSAVTAGVRGVHAVVTDARCRLAVGEGTVLFTGEMHQFSRSQQDALLPSVKNRWVTLITAITENPSFSVVSLLLSQSLLLTLQPLGADDIGCLIDRVLDDERDLAGTVDISKEAYEQIVRMADPDVHEVLTVLEAATGIVLAQISAFSSSPSIEVANVERAADMAVVRYDRVGDQHYDIISALIKSTRGSDPDATMHYLACTITAGEDPRYIARRTAIHAAEDMGLANPTALSTVAITQQATAMVGMPESRLILVEAALAVTTTPKSNAVTVALNESSADVRAGEAATVSTHLRDVHYTGAEGPGHGKGYRYSHDLPHIAVSQQYLPNGLESSRYCRPTSNSLEKQLASCFEAVEHTLDERQCVRLERLIWTELEDRLTPGGSDMGFRR